MFHPFLGLFQGSSPHVRGAPYHPPRVMAQSGIIPACAGSTYPSSPDGFPFRDHPRMCGEHLEGWKSRPESPGSSPHVRGAPLGSFFFNPHLGIIPACAGSTKS